MKIKLLMLILLARAIVVLGETPNINTSEGPIKSQDLNICLKQYSSADSNEIQRVRLQFSAEDGLFRSLLLGFTPDNAATDGFDYGYDAVNPDQYPNDMFWNINGQNYVIQGVGAFKDTKVYPLNVNITNACSISIALTGLENFDSEIDVFVFDSLLDTYTQINSLDFEIVLESAIYKNRFFIAFSNNTALSITENLQPSTVQVSYLTGSHEIFISSDILADIENIYLLNNKGQRIFTWEQQMLHKNIHTNLKIPVQQVAKGIYIMRVETEKSILKKKVIINN